MIYALWFTKMCIIWLRTDNAIQSGPLGFHCTVFKLVSIKERKNVSRGIYYVVRRSHSQHAGIWFHRVFVTFLFCKAQSQDCKTSLVMHLHALVLFHWPLFTLYVFICHFTFNHLLLLFLSLFNSVCFVLSPSAILNRLWQTVNGKFTI